jgi:hypothetical protein
LADFYRKKLGKCGRDKNQLINFLKIQIFRDCSAGWIHMGGNLLIMVLNTINFPILLGDTATAILPLGLTISVTVGALLDIIAAVILGTDIKACMRMAPGAWPQAQRKDSQMNAIVPCMRSGHACVLAHVRSRAWLLLYRLA